MKQLLALLQLSAFFGWPIAVYALYRMSTLCRCSPARIRWGYGLVLLGSLCQATSVFVLGEGGAGVVSAARALILGLTLLCVGLLVLLSTARLRHAHHPLR